MRRLRILLAAALIAGTAAACGRTGGAYQGGAAQPASQAITISVHNNYMLAMDIYAVSSGRSTRLGSVGPGMSDTLLLDPAMMPDGLVEVVAQPAGGGQTYRSGPLNPMPGQTIDFRIGINPVDSFVSIH